MAGRPVSQSEGRNDEGQGGRMKERAGGREGGKGGRVSDEENCECVHKTVPTPLRAPL